MNKEITFLFSGLIFHEGFDKKTIQIFSEEFGKVILESDIIPFDFTNYYEKEMGKNLLRKWILFDKNINQETIVDIKNKTIKIEMEFTTQERRLINIDPGYVTQSKVVLPTTKDCAHRIYLHNNIFAEITLIFYKGNWQPLKWTYMDYRTETALSFFKECREYILTGKTGEVGSKQ